MAHRQDSKKSGTELSDKENKRGKLERKKKRFSSSSGSDSDGSSSDSVSSSGSSSSTSSSGSSSGSSSTSSSSSCSNYSQEVTRKTRVRRIDKTTVTARVLKPVKKTKPLKIKDDKTKKAEKVKPKMIQKQRADSPRRKTVGLLVKRSPSPRSTKIHIGRLSRNVTREHIQEIFSTFGKIKTIDFPMDRNHPSLGKGFAYTEFETADEAENAMKHMDGAQIDGQEITAAPVLIPKPRQVPIHRRSPQRRPLPRWGGRSALRHRYNSPPCARGRSPPPPRPIHWIPRSRHRSRSPARRRRYSRSSSSKSH